MPSRVDYVRTPMSRPAGGRTSLRHKALPDAELQIHRDFPRRVPRALDVVDVHRLTDHMYVGTDTDQRIGQWRLRRHPRTTEGSRVGKGWYKKVNTRGSPI